MTPEQFVYWLQGFSEVTGKSPTPEEWKIIQEHLNLVFDKRTRQTSAKEQQSVPNFPKYFPDIRDAVQGAYSPNLIKPTVAIC